LEHGYFWLTKDQFARLKPHLPRDTRGKPRVDDRRVISGIVHVLISGCRWKDAPAVYGPRKTLYNRFQRWAAKGVWASLFHALATAGGPPAELLIAILLRSRRTVVPPEEKGGAKPGNRALSRRTDH
jgi:transposase